MHTGKYKGSNAAGQTVTYYAVQMLAQHITNDDESSGDSVVKIEAHLTREGNIVFRKVTYIYELVETLDEEDDADDEDDEDEDGVSGEATYTQVRKRKDKVVVLEGFITLDAAAAWAEKEPTLESSDFVLHMKANFAAHASAASVVPTDGEVVLSF